MPRVLLLLLIIASVSLPAYSIEFRLCPPDVESVVRTVNGDFSSVHIKLNDEAAKRLFALTSNAIGERLVFVGEAERPLIENPATIQTPLSNDIEFSLGNQRALELQKFLQQGSCFRR